MTPMAKNLTPLTPAADRLPPIVLKVTSVVVVLPLPLL